MNFLAGLNEAAGAAWAGSAGLSPEEARRHLMRELRSRGIILPPPAVDRLCQDITASERPRNRLLQSAKKAAEGAQFVNFLIRSVSAVVHQRPIPDWDVWGMRILTPIPQVRPEVILLDAAQEIISIGAEDRIEVWFGRIPHDEPAAPRGIDVFRGDEPIGTLESAGSQYYIDAVRGAYNDDLIPLIDGVRERQNDGQWRLYIGYLFPPTSLPSCWCCANRISAAPSAAGSSGPRVTPVFTGVQPQRQGGAAQVAGPPGEPGDSQFRSERPGLLPGAAGDRIAERLRRGFPGIAYATCTDEILGKRRQTLRLAARMRR